MQVLRHEVSAFHYRTRVYAVCGRDLVASNKSLLHFWNATEEECISLLILHMVAVFIICFGKGEVRGHGCVAERSSSVKPLTSCAGICKQHSLSSFQAS